jgi:hypothetical protein
VPIVLKSGSLNLLDPSGPVKACNGIALPLPVPVTAISFEAASPRLVENIFEIWTHAGAYFVRNNSIYSHGASAPSGAGSPRYRGSTITLRDTTLGMTPLDE